MYASTVFMALVAAVSAAPNAPHQGPYSAVVQKVETGDICGNNAKVQCCNPETADKVTGGLLGLDVSNVLGACTDITAALIGAVDLGSVCKQQTVCCGEIEQNGLVNLGCTPLNLL